MESPFFCVLILVFQEHVAELSSINLVGVTLRPVTARHGVGNPWGCLGWLFASHVHVASCPTSSRAIRHRTLWCSCISTPAYTQYIWLTLRQKKIKQQRSGIDLYEEGKTIPACNDRDFFGNESWDKLSVGERASHRLVYDWIWRIWKCVWDYIYI